MSSSTERDVWLVGTVLWLFDGRIRLRPSVTSQKSRLPLDSSRPLKVASATLVMVRPVMPNATDFSNCNMLHTYSTFFKANFAFLSAWQHDSFLTRTCPALCSLYSCSCKFPQISHRHSRESICYLFATLNFSKRDAMTHVGNFSHWDVLDIRLLKRASTWIGLF